MSKRIVRATVLRAVFLLYQILRILNECLETTMLKAEAVSPYPTGTGRVICTRHFEITVLEETFLSWPKERHFLW